MRDEVAILVFAADADAFAAAIVFYRFESPEHNDNRYYSKKEQDCNGGYDDNKNGIEGEDAMVIMGIWL